MPKIIFLSWVWMFTDMFLLSKSSYIFCVQIFSCLETWSSCLCQSGTIDYFMGSLPNCNNACVLCIFTCIAKGESRSRSAVTPSVCPSVRPKNLNPHHPRMLCAKFGWNIGPVVLEKRSKIGKVYRRTDGRTDIQTDDGWQGIRKAHLCSQLTWANQNYEQYVNS